MAVMAVLCAGEKMRGDDQPIMCAADLQWREEAWRLTEAGEG